MSRFGVLVARLFGRSLPRFENLDQARAQLFAERDTHLARLEDVSQRSGSFQPDYSPESLKALEAWYFELWRTSGFRTLGIDRGTFERCMGFYFGEVAVRNQSHAHWVVQEFPFTPGTYEIGVSEGLMTIMLTRSCKNHYKTPDNKEHQSLFRDYCKYFRLHKSAGIEDRE